MKARPICFILSASFLLFYLTSNLPILQASFNDRIARHPPQRRLGREQTEGEEGFAENKYVRTRTMKPIAECSKQGKKAKSFLMVFISRSGSTAISQTLNTHPAIKNMFELLDDRNISKKTSEAVHVTRTFFKETIASGLIPGFKIRSHHIMGDVEGWRKLIHEFDTRIIWQYRRNVVKTALGIYSRAVFNDSTATGGIRREDLERIGGAKNRCKMGVGCSFRIDDFYLLHQIMSARIRQETEALDAISILNNGRNCVFELPYEDYLYWKKEIMEELFRFLGLTLHTLKTSRIKATSDSLCDVISNFDDVCDVLYGCPLWQPFLHDSHDASCRCSNFKHTSGPFCSVVSNEHIAKYKIPVTIPKFTKPPWRAKAV